MATTRLFAITLLLLVLTIAVSSGYENGTARGEAFAFDHPRATEMIDAFDVTVQKRFHDVVGFGMARIATEHRFIPETQEEKAAVKSFKKVDLEVALYLIGRRTLLPKPREDQFNGFFDRAITYPIFVVSNSMRRELPASYALWDNAAESMNSFSQGKDLYESAIGKWNIRAHPVRATEECLNCHFHKEDIRVVFMERGASRAELNGYKVKPGDPIGAVFYVYKN